MLSGDEIASKMTGRLYVMPLNARSLTQLGNLTKIVSRLDLGTRVRRWGTGKLRSITDEVESKP